MKSVKKYSVDILQSHLDTERKNTEYVGITDRKLNLQWHIPQKTLQVVIYTFPHLLCIHFISCILPANINVNISIVE